MIEQKTKNRILLLYKILVDESSPEHPLSTNDLIKRLESYYDITANRITIGRDLKSLCDANLNIYKIKSSQHKFYYENTLFELTELKLIIDAISSARFISQSKSNALIEKIIPLADANRVAYLKRHVYSSVRVKTEATGGYYNVEAVNEAIDQNKEIHFQYIDYDVNKQRILRHEGQFYTVSPYAMVWDGDCYYVIGCTNDGKLRNYRLDRMVAQTLSIGDTGIPKPRSFDLSDYCKSVFRMYSTENPKDVTLLCEQIAMKAIIDNFGIDVSTKAIDDNHFIASVQVCTSPTFYRWVFGWGGSVKILSPQEAVAEYRILSEKAIESTK